MTLPYPVAVRSREFATKEVMPLESNVTLHASECLRVAVRDPLKTGEVVWIEFTDNDGGLHLGVFLTPGQIAEIADELCTYLDTLPRERQEGRSDPMESKKGKRPDWIANVVTGNGDSARWREIGVAFEGEQSITVLLDAAPIGGKIVLTRPKQKEAPEPIRAD